MTNSCALTWWGQPAEHRAKRMQRENEEWAAKNGPVMVRRVGEPLEAA